MKEQNYNNHVRYYTVHHFIFYPLVTVCFGASLWFASSGTQSAVVWSAFAVVFLFIAWESYMMRQHYALTGQNRTVRLELRLRYFILTQSRFEILERQLSLRQLFALRFAPDEELIELANRAIKEKMSPDEIKRAIRNWLPDNMRV